MPETTQHSVSIGRFQVGRDFPLTIIAGPCVIESESSAMSIAGRLKEITDRLNVSLIFKASYDKANRTSASSFRGPGIVEGLKILEKVRREFDLPILSDVHSESEATEAGEILDVLQIPAFLCRQTSLLLAAAETGKVVNVKKGQFLAPEDMSQVTRKLEEAQCKKILLTERGASFGYRNLVSDFRSIPTMASNGYPIIFDATHSVQKPGGLGHQSGGAREFAPLLARCAVVSGCDGVFFETHPDPDQALSDGPNMIPLDHMASLLAGLVQLRETYQTIPKVEGFY